MTSWSLQARAVIGSDRDRGTHQLQRAWPGRLRWNTERASQLLPFQYDGAEVDVVVRRQDNPPKFTEIACAIDGRIVAIPSRASQLTRPIGTAGPTAT